MTIMSSSGTRHSRNSQTANLHRFVQLNDRFETQVFTFIAPSHLSKGFLNEVFSRDFVYGNQKWCIQLTRSDRHVGTFLLLKNALAGLSVKVDYSFTVLNREHFTRNESFAEKGICFTVDRSRHGRPTFIGATDLVARNFLFDDARFLVELELRNYTTKFHDEIQLPRDQRELHNLDRLESSYFTFGNCDWNLIIAYNRESNGVSNNHPQVMHPTVMLQRHSRFEHWCRIRYRVLFSWENRQIDTSDVIQMLDVKGDCHAKDLDSSLLHQLNSRYPLKMELQLYEMCPIALVDLLPTSRNKNCVRCYDMDKQEWILESDILGRMVKARLYYVDINNVPRFFARVVCWNAYLIPFDKTKPKVHAMNAPFSCYYSQKENDEGFEMVFDLPVEEICDNNAGYTEPNSGLLSIQIEWLHSHLLYHDFYHQYDDVIRLQKHQMSREIMALQAENYALERQVHGYQHHISKDAVGTAGQNVSSTPNDNSTPRRIAVPFLTSALESLQLKASTVVASVSNSNHTAQSSSTSSSNCEVIYQEHSTASTRDNLHYQLSDHSHELHHQDASSLPLDVNDAVLKERKESSVVTTFDDSPQRPKKVVRDERRRSPISLDGPVRSRGGSPSMKVNSGSAGSTQHRKDVQLNI